MMKKRKIMFVTIILLILSVFIYVEMKPVSIISSTVFSTADQTEIKMYVIINSICKIDKEKIVEDVITEHQKINGRKENVIYTLMLYRTDFHFRKNVEYDTVVCGENRKIINEGL